MSPLKTALLWLASLSIGLTASALEVLWEFRPPLGTIDSSPAVADLDGDGGMDIVVTTTAGSTLAIDAQGHRIWMHGVQIPISISPTVANVMGDPDMEVFALNQSGRLYCLSGLTGVPLWHYDLPSGIEWGTTTIAVADIVGDGNPEIVTGDNSGHVVCLTPDGALVWQYNGDHGHTYAPALGEVGGVKSVIISGSQQPLVCLDGEANVRWKLDGPAVGAAPVIADIDGDGVNEVLTGMDNALIAVDGAGAVLWKHELPKAIDSSIAVADADEDGVLEIYAVDLSGVVVSLTPDGEVRWTADVRERVRRMPAVADLDYDATFEIYVAGYSGELYVFGAAGALEETIEMPGTTNATPTAADIFGFDLPNLVYASSGGSLTCYTWPNPRGKRGAQVGQYRYDAARTGVYRHGDTNSEVSLESVDFGKLYNGSNEFVVVVRNPEEAAIRIVLRAETELGRGFQERAQETSAPVARFAMSYTVSAMKHSEVSLECLVYEGDEVVAHRKREAYVVPFRQELSDLDSALSRLESAAEALPDNFDLMGRAAAVRTRFPGYREKADTAGTAMDTARRALSDSLLRDIASTQTLAQWTEAAAHYNAAGMWPVQVCAANPWAPFGGFDELHEGRINDNPLTVEAFHGEVESAAFNVFNYGAHAITARVEVEPLALEGSETTVLAHEVIDLHEVVAVPTQTLDLAADALPRMNQGHTLVVAGRDARQCWLNIDTAPLTPGTWQTTVRLKTLEVESKTFEMPLTVTVWKVPLADTNVLRHCNWGYVSRSFLAPFEDEALRDRISQGNNVFVSSFVPRAQYNEAGEIVGAIDFTEHDAFVARYAPHGLILFHNTGGISGPGGRDTEAYRKAFVTWMRAWVGHMNELGIDYTRYAMYPVDEPGLREGLVDLYLFYAKLVREADPQVLMYTDPVARITEEELRAMLPYVDIWCPNRNGFLLDSGAEKLAIMKGSGETLWNYECEGNAKHQSPLGYYRGQAWLAWRHGLTGIGFWSYCTSSADPWYRPQGTQDYLLVYPGEGPVSSKRWEAVRDGVEDYAMLVRLREVVAAAREADRAPNVVAEAERLLGDRASAIGAYCGLDEHGTTPGKGGMAGMRRVADLRHTTIQQARRDMARLMDTLEGAD